MSERSVLDVLIAARERISDEQHWTQSAMARAKSGRRVRPTSAQAVRWCALGAIDAERVKVSLLCNARDALSLAARALGVQHIVVLNDTAGHADVLRVFNRAIEDARAATGAAESGGQR